MIVFSSKCKKADLRPWDASAWNKFETCSNLWRYVFENHSTCVKKWNLCQKWGPHGLSELNGNKTGGWIHSTDVH